MSNSFKVIDLFAGVGGLSLGAERAGFKVIAAVEQEKRIIDSHARNFPNSIHICEDVSKLNPISLRKRSGVKTGELMGLIGGPPCQGFSSMGKRSLSDSRNRLFSDFYKLVLAMRPVFFLAENVPGILHPQHDRLRDKGNKLVEPYYLLLEPIKISANEFGAVTTRTRIFFIGVRNDIKGAASILDAIERSKSKIVFSVKDALAGLPKKINEDWNDVDSSWRKLRKNMVGNYVHSLNRITTDIGSGDAIERFLKKDEISGCFGTKHTREVIKRFAKLTPGQIDSISKAVKLDFDGFCPTLRAGTDNTKGSFQAVRPIHPEEARVITPREAARLQGFPDWFQFHETKWHSFRQIGNSVCPIVGEKVLTAIKVSLNI